MERISFEQYASDWAKNDYMMLANSPAEADMLRFLALYQIFSKNIPHDISLPRLRDYDPWMFYDKIYEGDSLLSHNLLEEISLSFERLKFENELSLNENEKYLAPYHPLLNNLPPLLISERSINYENLKCIDITSALKEMPFPYERLTTKKHFINQINALNSSILDRGQRLNQIAYVKRIQNHLHFSELNGQRGVFSKDFIQAGTIIDYYSGEFSFPKTAMPPILCTWRIFLERNYIRFLFHHKKTKHYHYWTDAFILGNMMKLVNSCYTSKKKLCNLGNIACYYFHFKSNNFYISLPVYVAIKDIAPHQELLTFYYVKDYYAPHTYGIRPENTA